MNIKVGEYEVAFHKLKESSRDADNDLVMPIETNLRHSHYQLDRKYGGQGHREAGGYVGGCRIFWRNTC
jgi:hypothetical protein